MIAYWTVAVVTKKLIYVLDPILIIHPTRKVLIEARQKLKQWLNLSILDGMYT